MGLLTKLFGLRIQCPLCGRMDAKDGLGGVKCVNEQCRNYDRVYAQAMAGESKTSGLPRETSGSTRVSPGGGTTRDNQANFQRVEEIEYLNFRGEERHFRIDADSIRDGGNFLSVRVEPTGTRINLKKERIRNRKRIS